MRKTLLIQLVWLMACQTHGGDSPGPSTPFAQTTSCEQIAQQLCDKACACRSDGSCVSTQGPQQNSVEISFTSHSDCLAFLATLCREKEKITRDDDSCLQKIDDNVCEAGSEGSTLRLTDSCFLNTGVCFFTDEAGNCLDNEGPKDVQCQEGKFVEVDGQCITNLLCLSLPGYHDGGGGVCKKEEACVDGYVLFQRDCLTAENHCLRQTGFVWYNDQCLSQIEYDKNQCLLDTYKIWENNQCLDRLIWDVYAFFGEYAGIQGIVENNYSNQFSATKISAHIYRFYAMGDLFYVFSEFVYPSTFNPGSPNAIAWSHGPFKAEKNNIYIECNDGLAQKKLIGTVSEKGFYIHQLYNSDCQFVPDSAFALEIKEGKVLEVAWGEVFSGTQWTARGTVSPKNECDIGKIPNANYSTCIAHNTCEKDLHYGGAGECLLKDQCSKGFHDGGDGFCVLVGQCAESYHDNGVGTCVQTGCEPTTYHDGGDGVCIFKGKCANGYHDDGRKIDVCVLNETCAVDYHLDGKGQCVNQGCAPGFHACNAVCVPNQSVNSCGSSCDPCVGPEKSLVTCDGMSCNYNCQEGFYKCGTECCWLDAQLMASRFGSEHDYAELILGKLNDIHFSIADDDLDHVYFDGKKSHIEPIGVNSYDTHFERISSMTMDSQDSPHVLFQYYAHDEVMHYFKKDGVWTKEQVSEVTDDVCDLWQNGWHQIVSDANDTLYALYITKNSDKPNTKILKYAKKSVSDTQWSYDVIEPELPNDVPASLYRYGRVATDKKNRLHVAYGARKALIYKVLDNNQWTTFPEIPLRKTPVDFAFVLDQKDMPHLVFGDKSYTYSYWKEMAWTAETLPVTIQDTPGRVAVAKDVDGNLHVLLQDNYILRYLRRHVETGVWDDNTIVSNYSADFTSMVPDPKSGVHMIYGNGKIYYIHIK